MSTFHIIVILGLFCGCLLFQKIPKLRNLNLESESIQLSIIIPSRNEEHNLPLILEDLKKQSFSPYEIICVNDSSTDRTEAVIKAFNSTYVEIKDKPLDWTGKTWACKVGGEKASGNLFLFIDADVRLGKHALEKLVSEYIKEEKVISVQPYHRVSKFYEHFAFFFNAIGIAGNGVGFKYSKKRAGLFGPIILMSHQVFSKMGGYYKVRKSVIEDVALGKVLDEEKVEYKLFVGEKDLSFKMYGSFKDLFLGFTKNYASGATQSPPLILILTFLWIMSITAIPLVVLESSIWFNQINLLIALGAYSLVVIQLLFVARAIGSFKKRYLVFYPMLLLIFHVVFFYSFMQSFLRKK